MCLILFAVEQHQDYPLVVVANRDEFYARPTRPAHWWQDTPSVYAGRDLQANGTWIGVDRLGRFAAVTNVREPEFKHEAPLSRGDLPREFLQQDRPAEDYLIDVQQNLTSYSGFNLLLADLSGCWFLSNRDTTIRKIPAGIYGVSNGRFDEPWPKLKTGKDALQRCLSTSPDIENLLSILTDRDQAADHELPNTGVSKEFERLLSSRFIRSNEYGTRAASVVLKSRNSLGFTEQNFDQTGALGDPSTEVIRLSS